MNIKKIFTAFIVVFLLFIVGCGETIECINHIDNDKNYYCDICNLKINAKVICPKCGAENNYDSIFCNKCATNLNDNCTHD